MMSRARDPLSVVIVALALAGCAGPSDRGPGGWRQEGASETRANDDEAECRRRARADVEREVRRDLHGGSGSGFDPDPIARPGAYESQIARHDARKRIERLTADCMRARGYSPKP